MATRISSRPPNLRQCPAGFTIVELLVVIVVIGLMASLLLPAIIAVRAAGQRTTCLNNLREIGLSTQLYVTAKDSYPPGWVGNPPSYVTTSPPALWMDYLKPYLNKGMAVYWCPADPNRTPSTFDPQIILSYGQNWCMFNAGDTAHNFFYGVLAYNVVHPNRVILYADTVANAANYSYNLYCGNDYFPPNPPFSDPVLGVAYRHPGGVFNAVYCDGHADSRTTTTQTDWDASQ